MSMNKKKSWLRRFWEWLFRPPVEDGWEEDALPEAPAALPDKSPAWQPQGQLYKMLDNRQKPLAGNTASKQETLRVYEYCGVVFPKADQVYHYINTGYDIHVGDRVLVPVHVHGEHKLAEGLVVSVGEYLAQCVPYPVHSTSQIIKRL